MYKHKIALDVGDVRIGVAVSDLLGITANPRETYWRKKDDLDADIRYFCEYAKKEDVCRISIFFIRLQSMIIPFLNKIFSTFNNSILWRNQKSHKTIDQCFNIISAP